MEKKIENLNEKNRSLRKRTTHFLIESLIFLIVVCVSVLAFFAFGMSHESEKVIDSVGNIYMSGMNERISEHFKTTIELRIAQMDTMIRSNPPEQVKSGEISIDNLIREGKMRDFESVALYYGDGSFDMLYGNDIIVTDPKPFLESLTNGDKKVAVATTNQNEKIVLIAEPVPYISKTGRESIALVASVSVDYIKKILELESDDMVTYSHIIRRDGSYVIRNNNEESENYFERFKDDNIEDEEHERKYVNELKMKMEADEDYSAIHIIGNERHHVNCTLLPYSEWYLVTVMPYGELDKAVNNLGTMIVWYLLIGAGTILLVLCIIFTMYFNMTKQQIRELEDARLEAVMANKAKSEFLSNMSHDIRTPMNAIVGMTAIATANIDNKQQVQNCLRKIALSGKHLLGLINDILDMSKIESGKMTLTIEQISLREVVDNIVNIIQPQIKAKKQNFDVFIHDIENENVYCDSVRLNQVLLNLLSNAVKFTPDGGTINLSVFEKPSPKGDNYIRIYMNVEDSGIGMSEEFRQKIFESFAREDNKRVHKTEGSGLGMAITKYIVDAMDGEITVDSKPGAGTEFHVTLDLEQAFIKEEDMVLPEWNMLVVDDDEQLCKSTAATLKTIGVKAEWTLDGETAVEMIKERRGKSNEYHIILLDWKLPGIDGIETARQIRRELGENIPILLISAYDWNEIEDEAHEAGISGFISKPLFKSTLYLGLRQYSDEVLETEEKHEDSMADFHGAKILVAEDNELNWEIANELLSTQFGLDMEWAENGKVCVEKFENSPEGYYDAILMDIRMPVMTGYEATEEIRKMNRGDKDLPIIAMTADAFSEDVQRCLDCGMNAHVSKPIDIKEIGRLMKKYLRK